MIKNLLLHIRGESKIEFNNLHTVLSPKQVAGENIYFCCGLKSKQSSRCKDSDIWKKKYFVVDIDIRKHHYDNDGTVITQEQLRERIGEIVIDIDQAGFGDYCAIVDSGNGMHIYYSGKERSFGINEYSRGVSHIYKELNKVIAPYECDPVTCNISRITRMPGTLNPRKKEKKGKILWDLGPTECEILYFIEKDSMLFEKIEDFAKIEQAADDEEKKIKIHKRENGNTDIWEAINEINAGDLACEIFGVTMGNVSGGVAPLKEKKKNMGAYYYEPNNVIVHGGSSLIKTNANEKKTFTSYELVYYELMNRDKTATVKYFKDRYSHIEKLSKKNIQVVDEEQHKNAEIKEHEHINKFFSFGIESIDKKFGMPVVGDLVLITGYPGSGKTEFSYAVAKNISKNDKVLYLSLELTADKMKRRSGRKVAGITKYQYQIGDYTDLQKKIMDSHIAKLNSYTNIKFVSYEESPTIDDVINTIKNNSEYQAVFIDAIGNMGGDGNELSRYAEITKKLRFYVRNHDVCIYAVHHMNKPTQKELYTSGGLAKIRGTQKVIDDCSIIYEVFRDQDPELGQGKERATVLVSQYKDTEDGYTGYVEIYFQKGKYVEEYVN